MAIIRFFHIENNLPDPFQDAPTLCLLLQGIKCSVGLSSKSCLPITMSLLRKLKTELAQAPDILLCDKLMLWSAFNIGLLCFPMFTSTLRLLLKCLHIPTELYASHSFRIRAATTAAEAGLPPWLIQTLGRWSSNCFALYIWTPLSTLQKVPGLLANAAAGTKSVWNPQEGRCTHLT